jgi:hypothetical protein
VKFWFTALLLALCGCTPQLKTYGSFSGTLPPGALMIIGAPQAQINVYKPLNGDPGDRFTVQLMARPDESPPPPAPPLLQPSGRVLRVNAGEAASALLVRVPDRVALDVRIGDGDVNVTDVTGVVDASTNHGEVKVMVPQYAQASSGAGNITVFMGATDWPGTLRFGTQRGDVEVWINATAQFGVHMHTDRGIIFTDFGLTGTSKGTAETIDGVVGGRPAKRGVDITVRDGDIRLLQLKPQI